MQVWITWTCLSMGPAVAGGVQVVPVWQAELLSVSLDWQS